MTYELITALLLFTFVATVTPGPNNIMLLASGMNYGVLRTIPHILGICLGFPAMVFFVGIGLSKVFDLFPQTYTIMKVLSTLYLLFLAWKIATAIRPDTDSIKQTGKPLTFLQAASFQWVNPKAWAMSMSAITLYAPPNPPLDNILLITLAFALTALPAISLWVFLGKKLRQLLGDDHKMRIFNIICAALLVISLYPMLMT